MKSSFSIVVALIVIILSACSMPQSTPTTPTNSPEELATEISTILTSVPSPSPIVTILPTQPVPQPTVTQQPPPSLTPETGVNPTTPPTTAPSLTPTFENTATPTTSTSLTPNTTITLPATDPKLQLGNPTWQDTMDDGTNWPLGEDEFTALETEDGFLKLTTRIKFDGWRMAWPVLKDFYLEMTMVNGSCTSSEHGGIIFRVPSIENADRGYLFGITCDGQYSVRKWDSTNMTNMVRWTTNSAIKTGSNQENRLGIMAVGNRLAFYINSIFLTEVQDESYAEGGFGIFVGSNLTTNYSILVDEISYWGQ